MRNFIVLIMLFSSIAQALDVKKLANNKESQSKQIGKSEIRQSQSWALNHHLGTELKVISLQLLQETLNDFLIRENHCDIAFEDLLVSKALDQGVLSSKDDLDIFAIYLRTENHIDDILFKILQDSHSLSDSFSSNSGNRASRPINLNTSSNEDIKTEDLYADFKKWPDENSLCSIESYQKIAFSFTAKNKNDRNRQLLRLNYLAYQKQIINLETYNKLEVLRTQDAIYAPILIKRYFDIIINAKDKLVIGAAETVSGNTFSTEYAERKEKLTERGRLYKQFDSTQIIMLSQLIEKAGKRRDAQSITLTIQYSSNPDDQENYVLSPLEKYRLSIKMLRNDMAALMRSENFNGTPIEYEDLISAAFETGLIKSEELDYILKFEELWNPKTPKWKTYANFAFSIAGTASFYLPPPWNFVGAIALVFTQTRLVNGKQPADPEDSWNIII